MSLKSVITEARAFLEAAFIEGDDIADDLAGFIDSDGDLYRSQLLPIWKNLTRKKKRDVYDPKLAVKLLMYLVEAGAKKYAKDMPEQLGGKPWNVYFPKKSRELVAQYFVDKFESDYSEQAFDFMKDKV